MADEDSLITYDGTNWIAPSLQNVPLLGVNTTADAINKLAVASAAILFNNIGNGCQIKINKAATGDTASFLFQTNFNGFAELGTTGDDDFHLKVSDDNFVTTYEAFIVDNTSGDTAFKENLTAEKMLKVDGFLRLPLASELTIASGAVTATKSHHKIDTESDAATDDLDTISGGSEGDFLVIEAANAARTVVVKHATGNIYTFSGADITLDDYGKAAKFFHDGTNWIEC